MPQFDSIPVDVSLPTNNAAGTTSPPPSAGGPIRVPPLNPEDVNKFTSLFDKSDVNRTGLLPGMCDFVAIELTMHPRLTYLSR